MLNKLVDFFIPNKTIDSGKDLRSDRILILVLSISAISDLLGINLAFEIKLTYVAYLLFINAFFILILLVLYKYGISKKWIVHIYILQHIISFAIQAWYQGGLISPAIASFFLLPAVTILILGKKSAFFWFVVTLLIITGFFLYENTFGSPQIIFDESKRAFLYFGGVVGTSIYIFIILLVYENNKNRALGLAERKNEDLIAAQNQLVHSEKMASLGELTAGIAHEIQNPLNFVNNFSEINKELLEELVEEIDKGHYDEVKALSDDILSNEAKIAHHGKRADGIVKSMLQHSRSSSGKKEMTNINELAGEYLRLAYHGLRAKDKSFNSDFKLDLDESLPEISAITQDIGRALLNMINNAFYAVYEKSKQNIADYKPFVAVKTRTLDKAIEIRVQDNGGGIPSKVLKKIFQPFFSTKPTGEGTGLGLSLSYDIITKGHRGTLEVDTVEGTGTEFIIKIPLGA